MTNIKLYDDVYSQLGNCFLGVGSPALPLLPQPVLTPSPTSVTINPLFWGWGAGSTYSPVNAVKQTTTNILGAGSSLAVGQKVEICFTALANTSLPGCSLANILKVDAPDVDPNKTSIPLGAAGGALACTPTLKTGVTSSMHIMCENVPLTMVPPPSLPTGTWSAFIIDKTKPIKDSVTGLDPLLHAIDPVTGLEIVPLTLVPTPAFEKSTISAGTFVGNVFTPNAAAISLGGAIQDVRIVWTPSTAIPACDIVPLSYDVKVNHLTVVDAGNVTLTCNSGELILSRLGATITNNLSGVTTGVWSTVSNAAGTGDGRFVNAAGLTDNVFATAVKYIPGPNDVLNGKATLRLTSTGNSIKCSPVFDDVDVYFARRKITIGFASNCERILTEADLVVPPGSTFTIHNFNRYLCCRIPC